jgi:HK97 family phage portal protein
VVKWWPWKRRETAQYSVGDPALVQHLGWSPPVYAGVEVTEATTLGISAVYRAVSLVAGTVGTLPMRTVRDVDGVTRQRTKSFLDEPGGVDGQTPFEWKETVLWHLLLHGNAFLLHRYNMAGALYALEPIHPLSVAVEQWMPQSNTPRPPGGKFFRVTLTDGTTEVLTARTMTHIPGPCMDGLRGMSPITVARQSLGTTIAGDRAAGKAFGDGALVRGVLTPEDDLDPDEAAEIRKDLDRDVAGWEHTAAVRVINRRLKFSPWSMSLVDAQFLQSRQFQIEEIARWFGVPPHLLMQTEKQTSWGTGVAEQNRAVSRTVLAPWATRIEQRLSRLLPSPRFVEFDFAGLERPTPEQEIDLLIKQVESGLLTLNEARAIRNMPPVEGGDTVRGVAPETPAEQPEAVPA